MVWSLFSFAIPQKKKSKKTTSKSLITKRKQTDYRIRKVVIDAGHGGHDPGCHGRYSKEKHVALSIALKLGKLIEDNHPETQVIYTRKTDKFVELQERAAIANRANADLFISIHCNAIASKSHRGTETWIMGTHKVADNLDVAKRENSAILLEDDYLKNYDGFNPNSPESNIIFSLTQNAYMDQSANLANKIEKQFVQFQGRESHGVKQAGFVVLWRAAMPSVLVETGFLTNSSDESIMGNARGQQKISEAIYRGFRAYKNEMEGNGGTDYNYISTEISENESYIDNSTNDNNEPNEGTLTVGEKYDDTATETIEEIKTYYTIQFHTSPAKVNLAKAPYNKITQVRIEKSGNKWVYFSGKYDNESTANQERDAIRKAGFKTAFVLKKN